MGPSRPAATATLKIPSGLACSKMSCKCLHVLIIMICNSVNNFVVITFETIRYVLSDGARNLKNVTSHALSTLRAVSDDVFSYECVVLASETNEIRQQDNGKSMFIV